MKNFFVSSVVPEIWVVAIWQPPHRQIRVQNYHICNKKKVFKFVYVTLNIVYI